MDKQQLEVPRDDLHFTGKPSHVEIKAKQKFSEGATVTLDIVFCVTID